MEALAFWSAVLIYIGLLCWCIKPVVCGRSSVIGATARILLVGFMLFQNVTPVFALVALRPLMVANEAAAERIMSVVLFFHSVPAYFQDLDDARGKSTTTVSMAYSMRVGSTKIYRIVPITCSRRNFLHAEKGLTIKLRRRFPSNTEGQVQLTVEKSILAFDHANAVCSLLRKGALAPGNLPAPRKWPLLFLIREQGNIRQVHAIQFPPSGGMKEFEDIALKTPVVLSIVRKTDDMDRSALGGWPKFELGWPNLGRANPPLVHKLIKLPEEARRCISFVDVDANLPKWGRNKFWQTLEEHRALENAWETTIQHRKNHGQDNDIDCQGS